MSSKRKRVDNNNVASKRKRDSSSCVDLRNKLDGLGIKVPSSFTKSQLVSLLEENSANVVQPSASNCASYVTGEPIDNSVSESLNPSMVKDLFESVKTLNETVQNQGEMINQLRNRDVTPPMDSLYSPQNVANVITRSTNFAPGEKVSSNMFPHVQVVNAAQRQQIIEGKYINLASLLIPSNDNFHDTKQINADGSVLLFKPKDARLQRDLSLSEFIEAFNIYKNVICESNDRRVEFDMYLQDIIDMAMKYKGTTFYDYHKAFAKKVAAIKETRGLIVDWSVRDEKLYSTVCTGKQVNMCGLCSSTFHITEMCPKSASKFPTFSPRTTSNFQTTNPQNSFPKGPVNDNDSYGRPKLFYKGQEVCNHFLAGNCRRPNCRFAHINVNGQSGTPSVQGTQPRSDKTQSGNK